MAAEDGGTHRQVYPSIVSIHSALESQVCVPRAHSSTTESEDSYSRLIGCGDSLNPPRATGRTREMNLTLDGAHD